MDKIRIGILTASDRASKKVYADESGKVIEGYLNDNITNEIEVNYLLVPDNFEDIKRGIVRLCDKADSHLVLTTGGTGPSPRDITPEATEAACMKILPGFGEQMRAESLKFVPTAILSRQTAGVRGQSLVVNLPGKPKAIKQCLDAIFGAIPDCLKILSGETIELKNSKSKIYH